MCYSKSLLIALLFISFNSASANALVQRINSPDDDIIEVGDPTLRNNGAAPGQGAANLISQDDGKKYYNLSRYGQNYPGSGFIVFPVCGASVVSEVELKSGNDSPDRDPTSLTLWGTKDDGKTFESIASGVAVAPFTGRNQSQRIEISNTKAYEGYKVLFPTVAGGHDLQLTAANLFGTVSPSASSAQTPPNTLWYTHPGKGEPEDGGLPIGNGRIGGLLMGDYPTDDMVFNEDSLWTGDANPSGNYNTMGSYEKFGDVTISFDHPGQIMRYRRTLDLAKALATVDYVVDGIRYQREAFASYPDQVLVRRLTADAPKAYSGTIAFTDGHKGTVTVEGNTLVDRGTLPNGEIYESRLLVSSGGGTLTATGNSIRFQDCDSVMMVLAAGTNYVMDPKRHYLGDDPHDRVAVQLKQASAKSYDQLKAAHLADYQPLFNRVSLDLGTSPIVRERMSTDLRRTMDNDGYDPAFEALMFQYGRYLLIASSRPGSLPANLNGLWCNNHIICHCDYHTNINIQMCYWQAEVTNLSECHLPFFDLTDSQLPPWRQVTAQDKDYNGSIPPDKVRGFDIRTSHNIWGGQGWLQDRGSNAWYCLHYWEHYAFTGDTNFLKTRAYPIIKEVCQYWEDHLKALPDGRLVVRQGWSPEQPVGPADGTSYQQEWVYDVFTHYIEASQILGVDADYRATIEKLRDKLFVPSIGARGQLQEWMADIDSKEFHHRHTSHLVGLFPANQFGLDKTPAMAQAARITLFERSMEGNTEWSSVWRASLWARLHEPEFAHRMLTNFNSGFTMPNLFGNCGSAQTDGNSGYSAAVAEMLLQSQNGQIELLPALPMAWNTGSVRGLRARGGFTVDMDWKDGKVTSYRISSASRQEVKVRINGEVKAITSEKGSL
jgi:alpha-L-fucosidase 2